MELNADDEKLFCDNITFTDIEEFDLKDFEQSLSFLKDYLSSQNVDEQKTKNVSNSQNKFNATQHSQTLSIHRQCSQNSSLQRNSVISSHQTNLSNWGLPPEILAKYASKGVTNMFQWQVECLGSSKIINEDGNLVYSAPTSAGKTLVAEILTIKAVLERQKKVIIILPFVSVVREKMFYFQEIFNGSGIRVEGYMGSHSPPGGFQAVHIAICTIEKANNLINSLLESKTISDLGAVVVDELHLLGDPHRGYILELLLTKLLYISRRDSDVHIQIIGMSATLPNLAVLSQWLNAELYKTDFRPIPLIEQYQINSCIYNASGELVRTIQKLDEIPNDKDNVISLSLETITQGCSVLIFCPSKNWCENLAQQISSSFRSLGYSSSSYSSVLREQLNGSALSEVLEQLKASPVGLDTVLHQTISFGVAFHHAGLTMDERDIIEGAFKRNIIRVLVSTSTLSSGVNLPARRVIVRSPTFCSKPINILTYKQMIGRAGRTGMDTAGESILICGPNEKNIGVGLISGTLDPVSSCLEGGDKLLRAVLEAIASDVARTPGDVELFINCTLLLNSLCDEESMKTYADEKIKELVDYELVRLQKTEDGTHYIATPLGKACLSSSMAPQDALILFKELQKARENFVLETDLHMIYLVTPYSICSQWGDINWMHMLNLWDGLSKAMRRVGELVGIQESLIYRCVRGSVKVDSPAFHNKLKILRRFYTSLALQDLINEVPLSVVATNYNCSRGMLQSLQQSAATFAGMVTAFSRQLGWKSFETLVSQFQDRLQFGIQSELLDLMRLQSLNGVRARAIFNSGIETVNQLAVTSPCLIENALLTAVPFQSEKERDGEVEFDVQQRNSMKNIWITGMKGVTAKEAATLLIDEARTYLQHELGVTEMKWQTKIHNVADVSTVNKNISVSLAESSTLSTTADDSDIHKALIANQSLNTSALNSPTFLSDSNKLLNIHEMTTQIPADQTVAEPHRQVFSVVSSPEALNICNSEDIKLELSPIGFSSETLNDISSFNKSKWRGSSGNDNDNSLKQNLDVDNSLKQNLDVDDSLKQNLDNDISLKQNSDNDNSLKQNFNIENSLKQNLDNDTSYKSDCSAFQSDVSKELSMFEESIEVDTQLCKLLDKSKTRNSEEVKSKDDKNSLKEVDFSINTDMFVSNFTSIENVFAAPFEESLKDPTVDDKEVRKSLDDVILSSQDDSSMNNTKINKVITPKRKTANVEVTQKTCIKRRRFLNSEIIFGDLEKSDIIASTPPRSFSNKSKENQETNKLVKISDFVSDGKCKKIKVPAITVSGLKKSSSSLYITDATGDSKNFFSYCHLILQAEVFAVFLDYESEKPVSKIGRNIVKKSHSTSTSVISSQIPNKSYQGKYIRSISIFAEKNSVYYFELKNDSQDEIDFIKSFFANKNTTVIMYDCKQSFMAMHRCLDVTVNSRWEDPVVAEWLLDPESYSKPLYKMFESYCSIDMKAILKSRPIIEIICLNAWATYHTMTQLKNTIRRKHAGLLVTFGNEMKALRVIAECERCGMLVDKNRASQVLDEVKNTQSTLEKLAFKLAGQRFNFSSPSSVAKVLGIYNGHKVSTNKKALEKIENPLAKIIIYWRKLSAVLLKNLFPLTAKATECLKDKRIYGTYWTLTSTGRISMQEPNLQSMPRNFEIPAELFQTTSNNVGAPNTYFSCRDIFPSVSGNVLVSADYCQLELRLLTHLCGDATLRKIVTSGQDIFKAIAATWKNITEEEVDDDLRQQAKQMCYGIIYGMGCKTLSQMLDICELEASVFINTFHSAYPGIQQYVDKVVENCRKQGYVETLSGRRRYLPLINSASFSEKSHAERQAVNTTIQGSAADILKLAMISVFDKLEQSSAFVYKDLKLILLLHDELIYEVSENVLHGFIYILRECMENTVKISVPLPVKVKTGKLWGSMVEVTD